jgi:pentatricopeptide repeat protein
MGRRGDVAGARELLSQLQDRTIQHYNAMLKGYVIKQDVPAVDQLLTEMWSSPGIVPNATTFSILIDLHAGKNCHKADDGEPGVAKSLELIQAMKEKGVTLQTWAFTPILNYYTRSGQPKRADDTLESMIECGVVPETTSFTAVMGSYGRQEPPNDAAAIKLLQRMLQLSKTHPQVTPDTITFNQLLTMYSAMLNLEKVKLTFAQMRKLGVSANSHTYRVIIAACCRDKDERTADILWQEHLQRGQVPEPPTLYSLLVLYAGQDNTAKVLDLWSMAQKYKIQLNRSTLCTVMECLGRANQFQKSIDVYNATISFSASLSTTEATTTQTKRENAFEPNTYVLLLLVRQCGMLNRLDWAIKFWDELTFIKFQLQPDIRNYTSLVALCGRCGDVKKAFQVLDKLFLAQSTNPDLINYSLTDTFVRTVLERNNVFSAADLKMTEEMRRWGYRDDSDRNKSLDSQQVAAFKESVGMWQSYINSNPDALLRNRLNRRRRP